MNMKASKVFLIAALSAVGFGFTASAAKGGSYEGKATGITFGSSAATKTVELVGAYDPDTGETDEDYGVYYFSATLKKNQKYSFWVTGYDEEDVSHYWYWRATTEKEDDKGITEPFAEFENEIHDDYYVLRSWDEEDPDSWKVFICLEGSVGSKATLHYQLGDHDYQYPLGTEENPDSFSLKYDAQTYSVGSKELDKIEEQYCYKVSLKANYKYYFAATGGTADDMHLISVEGYGDKTDDPQYVLAPEDFTGAYNEGYIVYPEKSGTYLIRLTSDSGSGKVGVKYRAVSPRKIGDHTAKQLVPAGTEVEPGYLNAQLAKEFYDDIIDEELCFIDLEAGKSYLFDAVAGANPTNLLLRVYDKNGTMLIENRSKDGLSLDCRAAITAGYSGRYYVGVCQAVADWVFGPLKAEGVTATVSMKEVACEDPETIVLAAKPSLQAESPADVDPEGSESAKFTEGIWSQTYEIEVFKNLGYELKAEFLNPSDNALSLKAEVTYVNAKGVVTAIETGGEMTPGKGNGLTFVAPLTGLVTVKVSVGAGLDYPEFKVHSRFCSAVNNVEMSLIKPLIKGWADATWYLSSDTAVKHKSGDEVYCAGKQTLNFSKDESKFSYPLPANSKYQFTTNNLPAFKAGPTVLGPFVYNDKFDPDDDTIKWTSTKKSGKTVKTCTAIQLKPTHAGITAPRTLYTGDSADCFYFTAAAGVQYNFALVDVKGYAADGTEIPGAGDPVMMISNDVDGVVAEGVTATNRVFLAAGNNYIIVTHRDPAAPEDSSYTLAVSSANVGKVKFKALDKRGNIDVSVKENTAYAKVTVQRTQKEGAVNVEFGTYAGTAKPGENYYPTNGVISWADGDKADKTISVRLIPNLVPTHEENKQFQVILRPSETELDDGEYAAVISGKTNCTVTITEATKAVPGTVSLSAYDLGTGAGAVKVSNVKKPVAKALAGYRGTLIFSRTGGSDGRIEVKIGTKDGTAKTLVDYLVTATNLVWESGDSDEKRVTVETSSEAFTYQVSKAFTVSMAAVKKTGNATPSLSAKTATVNLYSDKVTESLAAYAKTLPKSVAIKSSGTWVVGGEEAGETSVIASKPLAKKGASASVTFTLTGPGYFRCTPELIDDDDVGATVTYKIDKKSYTWDSDEANDIIALLASGKHTVSITVKAKATPASGETGPSLLLYGDLVAPFVWIPIAPTCVEPYTKAVIDPAVTNAVFTWKDPNLAAQDENGVFFRFSLAENAKNLGKADKAFIYDEDLDYFIDEEFGSFVFNYSGPSFVQNRTYYWRIDFGLQDEEGNVTWVPGKNVWSFSTVASSDAPQVNITGSDIEGYPVSIGWMPVDPDVITVSNGIPVRLRCGVKAAFDLAASNVEDTVSYALRGGSLPPGLKLANGRITGAPSKAGTYTALLQANNVKSERKKGKTVKTTTLGLTTPVVFTVDSLGIAAGTFAAVLRADDGNESPSGVSEYASLSLTVSAAGAFSASAKIAGTTYKFTGTGYDEVSLTDGWSSEDFTGVSASNTVTLLNVQKVKSGKKYLYYTNTLELVVADGKVDDIAVMGIVNGSAVLSMGNTALDGVVYSGDLLRDNSAVAEVQSALAPFAGYYTAGLVESSCDVADAPAGDCYLLVTVDAKGKVKVTGATGSGTAISASATGHLVGDLEAESGFQLLIPVYWLKSTQLVAGTCRLFLESREDESTVSVFDPDDCLSWNNDSKSSTKDGGYGFRKSSTVVGGFYDTVFNLQRYYLTSEFTVDNVSDWLPDELLASGYDFVTETYPDDMEILFNGNTPTVPASKMVTKTVKVGGKKVKLNVWEKCVNPGAVSFTFKRATGVMSGSFNIWTENEAGTSQSKKAFKHAGVVLWNRSANDCLDREFSVGYCLSPKITMTTALGASVKHSWVSSAPFRILRTENGEPDWGADDWNPDAVPETED